MKRSEAIDEIKAKHPGAAFVFSNGLTAREAAFASDAPNHFYMLHGMGESLSVGIGLAHAAGGVDVVVIDGDGNFAMGLASMLELPVPHLHYYVLVNGIHETTGGQKLHSIENLRGLEKSGVTFIEVEPGTLGSPNPPQPDFIKTRFMDWLCEQKKKTG
jgi:thiamine pyrophosphate-dependent acetolactate synthase large subunit-like protein